MTTIEEQHHAIDVATLAAADAARRAAALPPNIRWLFWIVLESSCRRGRGVDREKTDEP